MNQLSNCTILLVDDSKTNIDVLVQALKNDYKLGVALEGEKAIEYAHIHSPDLILLDILMPGMDGFEVCREIKKDPDTKDIPIIFITAVDDTGHKTKGFEYGAVDYITKPFDITEVKARVKTHLTLKIAQAALINQNAILEEKVLERTIELKKTQLEIIDRLGMAAEYRDKETGKHIKRMSKYCRVLGQALGMSKAEYDILDLASTMHDLGKIGISDTILLKPGRLSPQERKSMMTHTEIGARLLSGSNSKLLEIAKVIAKTHHEKWDGTGYDDGLQGDKIPLFGRIVCVCDVFDALISERPYKQAWSFDDALNEIDSGIGTFFDPELVKLFFSLGPEIRRVMDKYK